MYFFALLPYFVKLHGQVHGLAFALHMVSTVLESPGMSWDLLFVLECPGISRLSPFFLEMSLNFSMIARGQGLI